VVVDYLDVNRTGFRPSEADPVLLVDTDAVLPSAVSAESLETITGRYSQVVQDLGLVERVESSRSHSPQRVG
jgi:hypothetical protein